MGLEKDLERDWIRLNEYEMKWRARRDDLDVRDFERRPWTVEDQNAILDIVRFMSGAVERIEMRQAVLYRIAHAQLSDIRGIWYSAIVAALVLGAIEMFKRLIH